MLYETSTMLKEMKRTYLHALRRLRRMTMRPPHCVVTEQLAFLHRSLRKRRRRRSMSSSCSRSTRRGAGCCGSAELLHVEDAVQAAGNLLTQPPLNRGFVLCQRVLTESASGHAPTGRPRNGGVAL